MYRYSAAVLALLVMLLCGTTVAYAACPTGLQSCSTKYGVNEVYFGSGGQLHACSGGPVGYCAKQSAGELTVGAICDPSNIYCAQAGFNTDRVPSLTFVVNSANTNLGAMSSGTTKTATGTFSVYSYLTSGYVVINASNPPSNGTYTMNALSSPTASSSSAEQFGINLVANTSPSIAGSSAPVQIPSGTFSFGAAAAGYNTTNLFKYVKGDTIASSSKSSGETDYTISYIFNISPTTPGGTYTMNHVLVATSTF